MIKNSDDVKVLDGGLKLEREVSKRNVCAVGCTLSLFEDIGPVLPGMNRGVSVNPYHILNEGFLSYITTSWVNIRRSSAKSFIGMNIDDAVALCSFMSSKDPSEAAVWLFSEYYPIKSKIIESVEFPNARRYDARFVDEFISFSTDLGDFNIDLDSHGVSSLRLYQGSDFLFSMQLPRQFKSTEFSKMTVQEVISFYKALTKLLLQANLHETKNHYDMMVEDIMRVVIQD